MIGLRVKGPACAAVLLLAFASVVGCSKSGQPRTDARVSPPSMPVGAERWQDGALLLPAKSPVVASGRLDAVLRAATRLKSWVTAEPAMLGPDGPRIVRTIDSGWLAATAYLGVDPLLDEAWTQRGVDPERPVYAGLYPVQRDGRRFIVAIETVLREELGVAPGDPVAPSIQLLAAAGGELPEGTNARIIRTLSETQPLGGLRVVVGVTSPSEFLTTASSFAEGMGFRAFPKSVTGEDRTHVYWSDSGVPGMAIRFVGPWAVLDLLFPAFVGGARKAVDPEQDLVALHADLMRATGELNPGRPHAPTPPGDPVLAVSFDQAGVAELVRLRGYHDSLEAMQTASADRRDAELLASLVTTVSQAQAWSVASDELTGTTYQLSIDELDPSRVGSLQMTMFARRGLPAVDTASEQPTLRLDRRDTALGLDLRTLRTDTWRKWFVAETAAEIGALQFDALPDTTDLLPILRSGALAVADIGHASGTSAVFSELIGQVAELEQVERVEIVGLGPTMPNMQQRPEVLIAAVMAKGASAAQINETQASVGELLADWSSFEPDSSAAVVPIEGRTTSSFLSGAQRTTDIPIHHHLIAGERQVLLTGFGVPVERFDAEVSEIELAPVDGVVEARLGPIALVSWLVDDSGELMFDLDPDIVAQRIGALNLDYAATPQGESQAVTVKLELEAPPKL